MKIVDPRQASIFVVEDNHHNQFVFEILLIETVGVRYYQSLTSGKELLSAIAKHPTMTIDIVLLDIRLPGDDGYTICRQLRDHPRFVDTTIVAITAEASSETLQRAREAGFDSFIGKPIDRNRFPAQIRKICAGEAVWEHRF